MAKKNRNSDTMAYDVFEREYEDEISWETERLLGQGEYEDDEYDAAFEAAIDVVAAAKGITLVWNKACKFPIKSYPYLCC